MKPEQTINIKVAVEGSPSQGFFLGFMLGGGLTFFFMKSSFINTLISRLNLKGL
jgi:hypothetical protein